MFSALVSPCYLLFVGKENKWLWKENEQSKINIYRDKKWWNILEELKKISREKIQFTIVLL